MRYGTRAILAGGFGFAVSLLAACGGHGGLLTGDQATQLNNQLDQVSSAVSARDCAAASSAAKSLETEVLGLPSSVDATLRSDLSQGASTVNELALRDCRQTTPTVSTASTSTVTTTANSATTTTNSNTAAAPTNPAPATTPANSGTTSTGGSGGVGLGGGRGSGGVGPPGGNTTNGP